MKITTKYRILVVIFLVIGFESIFAEDMRTKYEWQPETLDGRFDCTKNSPCQIQFRRDHKEYLDLKYYHKKKLEYQLDRMGYYYMTYNPLKVKELMKIRVQFTKVISGNKTVEIGIDTETQSGQVYITNIGSEKPSWRYLLPETPTLSPVINREQILVCADHPVEGGKLYSLNAKTGKLDWFFLTPGAILSYPVFFENFIIIIDDSGNIYWVDRETGLQRYKYIMEEFPVPNPIIKDKILYLAGRRGHLYAVKLYDAYTSWKDLALVGEVTQMNFQKKGFVILGGNQYWLFNYSNGAKQDKVNSAYSSD